MVAPLKVVSYDQPFCAKTKALVSKRRLLVQPSASPLSAVPARAMAAEAAVVAAPLIAKRSASLIAKP